jgi:hypothetical protein
MLEWLAKGCAILAGALLTVITLMTCVSLIGRNTTGWTIVGDFELSGAAAGAAIALFMPWCQLRRGTSSSTSSPPVPVRRRRRGWTAWARCCWRWHWA